jgi:hypothetical protein
MPFRKSLYVAIYLPAEESKQKDYGIFFLMRICEVSPRVIQFY